MVEALLLHRYSLALSPTLSSTATNLVRVLRRLASPCHTHRSRTSQRHQVPRPTRSRHSVPFSLILRWASLVMSVHRLCHCALCLQRTTLPQQTPLRNSLSRSFRSCVPNTPSGVQFHSAFMKTFVKHRPPSNTANPSEGTFADAATQLSFAELFERCILSRAIPPRPQLCFKKHLLRLPHTVPLSQMRPLNSRSQSSFLGASIPLTRWIDSLLFLRMGTLVAPQFPIPST